jgi:flagellar biosynthesis/type III secretory pathway protein FliH
VIKLEESFKPEVKSYDFQGFGGSGAAGSRPQVSSGAQKNQKDSRFRVSELSRDRRSIEQEEEERIQQRVQNRLVEAQARAEEAARKAGYEAGLQKGRDEALAAFRETAKPALDGITKLVTEFEECKDRVFQANEQILLESAFQIAKRLFLKEVSTDREYVIRLAHEVVSKLTHRDTIRIRVNPSDLDTVASLREELGKRFQDLRNISIEASDRVSSGGLVLDTDFSMIDARIEAQVLEFEKSLLQSQPAGGQSA